MQTITMPVAFSGVGPGGVVFADGVGQTDDEDVLQYCRDAGYEVTDGPAHHTHVHVSLAFDPADHTVPEVLAHLRDSDDEEQARVLALEADGKARQTILTASP